MRLGVGCRQGCPGRVKTVSGIDESVPRLDIPRLTISPHALFEMERGLEEPLELLWRHACCDWGEVNDDDRGLNEAGLAEGNALLGIYPLVTGESLVLLTEFCHQVTHMMTLAEHPLGRNGSLDVERQPVLMITRSDGPSPRFPLGAVTLSPAVIQALVISGGSPLPFLRRHASADWGIASEKQKRSNRRWLIERGRLCSTYRTMLGDVLWVETEADRRATSMILRQEK